MLLKEVIYFWGKSLTPLNFPPGFITPITFWTTLGAARPAKTPAAAMPRLAVKAMLSLDVAIGEPVERIFKL